MLSPHPPIFRCSGCWQRTNILRQRPTLASGVHHRSGPRNCKEGGTQIGGGPWADMMFNTRTRFCECVFLMFRTLGTLSKGKISCMYKLKLLKAARYLIHPSAMQNRIINHRGAPNRTHQGRKAPLLSSLWFPFAPHTCRRRRRPRGAFP